MASDFPGPRYPALVEASAKRYRDYLISSREQVAAVGLRAIDELVYSIDTALRERGRLTARDVTFGPHLMEGLRGHPTQAAQFINEFCLGFGDDRAPILVIGTEEAYDPEDPPSLASWNCGCSILWLCGSRANVLAKLAGGAAWVTNGHRPFHLHANDYFRVRGNHTWKCVSKLAAWAQGSSDSTGYLRPASGHSGLGRATYQIELSAFPSQRAASGKSVTSPRLDFLTELVYQMRPTAKAIILHGADNPDTRRARHRLASTFLGLTDTELAIQREGFRTTSPRRSITYEIQWQAHERRVALIMRALSMAIPNQLLELAANIIRREALEPTI